MLEKVIEIIIDQNLCTCSAFTLHRRGYGVDVEALHGRFPLQRSAAKTPIWGLADTEGYDGGNCVSWCPWMFTWYVGIYRRKKYIGGPPWGPGERGGRPGGVGAPSYLMAASFVA